MIFIKEMLQEIDNYIENELFKKLFVFHPEYSIWGKPDKKICSEIKSLDTQVIISMDRK